MLLSEVADASKALGETSSRLSKRAILSELLLRTEPADLEVVVAYLAGELRQRRTGVGWASLSSLPPPSASATLTVADADSRLAAISALAGQGSAAARAAAVAELFGLATAAEQRLLRGLISGDVRQGALDAAMLDAIAAASRVPLPAIRRAAMLSGATAPVARAALTEGETAVAAIRLSVGRPVRPMLASAASDVATALDRIGGPACLDTKLDGIRIQVHRDGDDVRVFTRSLDEITARMGDVVAITRQLQTSAAILDGEALMLDADGRPRPFQETASRTATQAADDAPAGGRGQLRPFFFDILHLDGADLIDLPLTERLGRLDRLVPSEHRVGRLVTADLAQAESFFASTIETGHEGLVVKSPDAGYDAGRRGAAWVKVKPRHTLDLVVLAVEWGSGRRQGWLSNIHVGARDPESGSFVMLGKTFKGMTDDMLAWQTERFLELETHRAGHVVHVRPAQVVEIAFDGVQRSSRYAGGVALRFARVVRYRDDKRAGEADTIDSLRSLLP